MFDKKGNKVKIYASDKLIYYLSLYIKWLNVELQWSFCMKRN